MAINAAERGNQTSIETSSEIPLSVRHARAIYCVPSFTSESRGTNPLQGSHHRSGKSSSRGDRNQHVPS